MNRRPNDRTADHDFVESNLDDFPVTDKMPLTKDYADTDFQDSLTVEEMDQETMSAALYAEFESSRINSEFNTKEKESEKVDDRVWKFEFTDSAEDLKHGTTVKEIKSSEDLFNKYFK